MSRPSKRVVVTQPIHPEELARLNQCGFEVIDHASPTPLSSAQIRSATGSTNTLICHLTDQIDEAVVAIPMLEVISTASVGVDHIDLEAARRIGVRVANTPGVLTEATADLAMALILSAARRIPECDTFVRSGAFTGWRLLSEPMGLDVSGATLGIVGMGRIGAAVARRAHFGFSMPIVYTSRNARPDVETELGARRVDLDELLQESDVVSLHAPLSNETIHLIDEAALNMMRPNALLINTARGPLIDEAALARALARHQIAGAGLDVFEREPQVDASLLTCRERVVLAPHVGSATERTRRLMSHLAVDGVLGVLNNEDIGHFIV